jgi:hypothetical protein
MNPPPENSQPRIILTCSLCITFCRRLPSSLPLEQRK